MNRPHAYWSQLSADSQPLLAPMLFPQYEVGIKSAPSAAQPYVFPDYARICAQLFHSEAIDIPKWCDFTTTEQTLILWWATYDISLLMWNVLNQQLLYVDGRGYLSSFHWPFEHPHAQCSDRSAQLHGFDLLHARTAYHQLDSYVASSPQQVIQSWNLPSAIGANSLMYVVRGDAQCAFVTPALPTFDHILWKSSFTHQWIRRSTDKVGISAHKSSNGCAFKVLQIGQGQICAMFDGNISCINRSSNNAQFNRPLDRESMIVANSGTVLNLVNIYSGMQARTRDDRVSLWLWHNIYSMNAHNDHLT